MLIDPAETHRLRQAFEPYPIPPVISLRNAAGGFFGEPLAVYLVCAGYGDFVKEEDAARVGVGGAVGEEELLERRLVRVFALVQHDPRGPALRL